MPRHFAVLLAVGSLLGAAGCGGGAGTQDGDAFVLVLSTTRGGVERIDWHVEGRLSDDRREAMATIRAPEVPIPELAAGVKVNWDASVFATGSERRARQEARSGQLGQLPDVVDTLLAMGAAGKSDVPGLRELIPVDAIHTNRRLRLRRAPTGALAEVVVQEDAANIPTLAPGSRQFRLFLGAAVTAAPGVRASARSPATPGPAPTAPASPTPAPTPPAPATATAPGAATSDSAAKSNARNAVTLFESCVTTRPSGCDAVVPAGVQAQISTPETYVLSSRSASGATFTISRDVTGFTRRCNPPGAGGCPTTGAW